MGVETIVARGFGTFGGGIVKVPTRGYSIGSPAPTLVLPIARFAADYGYQVNVAADYPFLVSVSEDVPG